MSSSRYSLGFTCFSMLLLISPKSRQSCRVDAHFSVFQDLLWEKTFKNKDGQPMTVIRSKVQWSRFAAPMMAVICKCRLFIIVIASKGFILRVG